MGIVNVICAGRVGVGCRHSIEVDMAQNFSRQLYNSAHWKRTRKAYISSVHYQCERCGEPGQELHHKIALSPSNINNPEIAYGWSNLQYLCFRCHQQITKGTEGATRDGLRFDDDGQVVPIGVLQN